MRCLRLFGRPALHQALCIQAIPGSNPTLFVLAASAALDKAGEKFVPGLCKACHGANTFGTQFWPTTISSTPGDDAETGNVGVKFLPFDLDNFDYGAGDFSRSAQESKFKQLNDMILNTNATDAVRELIGGAGIVTRLSKIANLYQTNGKAKDSSCTETS